MKPTQTLFVGLALAALVSAPIAFAAARVQPEESGLEGSMQSLNGAVKRMNKAFEKPDLEAVVKTAVEMQKTVLAAKTETPAKTADQGDDKAKAAFVLGFRKQMITLNRSLLDLEMLALDGKADEAKKLFTETIAPMKKEGHAKYKD